MVKRVMPLTVVLAVACAGQVNAEPPTYWSIWSPEEAGIAYGIAANVYRTLGSKRPLADLTVAAQLTARNGTGVHQWVFGIASEAWALKGSRSILIGLETAVINEEPMNQYPKVANNAVMKNRIDGSRAPTIP